MYRPFSVTGGKLTDCGNVVFAERFGGLPTDEKQVADREREHYLFPVITVYVGDGVGLFVVAAKFGENLIPRYADADCDADFAMNPLTDSVSTGQSVIIKIMEATCEVEEAFIYAKPFNQWRVLLIDCVYSLAEISVLAVVRRHKHKVGAFALGAVNRFGCLHLEFFSQLVFGEGQSWGHPKPRPCRFSGSPATAIGTLRSAGL
jgi:hypothetical protein